MNAKQSNVRMADGKWWYAILVLLMPAAFASSAAGAILEVPAQYASIGSAMDVAQWGDTVLVGAGAYFEAVSLPAGVTLLSTSGPDSTYISPQDGQPALTFLAPPPSAVGAETMCRGLYLGQSDPWGVPPVVSYNSKAVVEDCRVYNADNADNFWPLFYFGGGEIVRECELWNQGSGMMFRTYAVNAKILVEDCEIMYGLTGESGLCCQKSGSELMFRNNTFNSGIDIAFASGPTDFTFEFVDNIFYDSGLWLEPDYPVPDSLSFRHNVYWNCTFRDTPEDFFVGGFGNFEANPLFCADPLTHWLEPESPCIGAGETGENIGARFGVCDVASVPETTPDGDTVPEFVRGSLRVWPNPSTGSVEIALADGFDGANFGGTDSDETDLEAAIFGINGRRLVTLDRTTATETLNWNGRIGDLPAPNGTYIVILRRDGRVVAAEKFVLAR